LPLVLDCRAHGYLFDQAAFIAAHRRKPKVCAFLQQFRNSQMLEVFITERLKLAAEGYVTEDPFELLVTDRNTRASMRIGIGGGIGIGMGGGSANIIGGSGPQKGRISSLLRKAGSAVKQSGGSVFASIQRLGTSQQEEHQVAGCVPLFEGPAAFGLGVSNGGSLLHIKPHQAVGALVGAVPPADACCEPKLPAGVRTVGPTSHA
jgi:hypothetical protein